jgi:signal transduction histidine kinase
MVGPRATARWRSHARLVGFGVAYYLLAWVSYRASLSPSGDLAAWWAPSGLALATLIRARRRGIPAYLVAIGLAAAAVNVQQPITAFTIFYRSVADIAEPLASAWVLRRLFGRHMGLTSRREVAGFAVVGGLLGPTVGTMLAALGLWSTGAGWREVSTFGLVWWGSAALGAILFAPVLLTWRPPRRLVRRERLLEAGLLSGALGVLTAGALFVTHQPPVAVVIGFGAFPLLSWAAVRFGPTGAARATVALSLLSLWPFLDTVAPLPWQLVVMQGLFAVGALTALGLSALTLEMEKLRRRAESQASRAEESLALLESALRGAPFGIAFFDRALRVTRQNEVFTSLSPASAKGLVGRSLNEVLPDLASRLQPVLSSVCAQGGPAEVEVETLGGSHRHWLCLAFPVRVCGQAPLGVGLLMMDVTERKVAEADRARLLQQAQEAVRVREDFLSIASHELKTPLTPLAARLAQLQRKVRAGQPISPESIDKPLQSLRKLTELINDLLDASRIDHGRLLLRPEPVPIAEVVRRSAEPFLGMSGRHVIRLDLPDEALWVNVDRQRLGQVVANLLDNAIKYSPSGGTVHVRVRPHPDGLELTVSDEGIGIPPAQRERLFERFYRAANSSVSYGGLGLGLYITRDIVDRHGGRIWAESTPGRGATFHVVLPRLDHDAVHHALH